MSTGYKVVWSETAVRGTEDIVKYLDMEWGSKTTNEFLIKLKEHISLISRNPNLFRLVEGKKYIHQSVLTKQTTVYYEFKKKEYN